MTQNRYRGARSDTCDTQAVITAVPCLRSYRTALRHGLTEARCR